jgi:hypothetical protein
MKHCPSGRTLSMPCSISGGPSMILVLLSLFFFNYCFTLVSTALHAYMVRENGFMTLRAQGDVGQVQVMM